MKKRKKKCLKYIVILRNCPFLELISSVILGLTQFIAKFYPYAALKTYLSSFTCLNFKPPLSDCSLGFSRCRSCLTSRDCQSAGTSRIAKPRRVVHAEILWADFKRANRKIRSKLGQLILARIFSIKPCGTRRGWVGATKHDVEWAFPPATKTWSRSQREQEPPPFCPALLTVRKSPDSGETLFLRWDLVV